LNGYIAALDGWLCRIQIPAAAEAMNKASCFSGQHQCHSLNVQAACDASCRFIFIPFDALVALVIARHFIVLG
jgi:hypothetical protein